MTPTIEDVLKKHGFHYEQKSYTVDSFSLYDAAKAAMTEYASLNRQGWTRVEDGLPGYDELVIVYGQRKLSQPSMGGNPDTVMVGQRMNIKGTGIEKQRERYVDKNEFRQMNYVTHWMPLPNKPI